MAQKEIELKFRIDNFNNDILQQCSYNNIEQYYLDPIENEQLIKKYNIDFNIDDIKETRIRKKGEKYYLTMKSDGNVIRDEFEIAISKNEYDDIKQNYKIIGEIEKIRYEYGFQDYILEIDVYQGKLSNLVIAEVELKNVDEIDNVKNLLSKLNLSFVDVTNDKYYKNKNLAKMVKL